MMIRVGLFIFGYRILRVEKENISGLLSDLLRLGVDASISPDGYFLVSERGYKLLKKSRKAPVFSVSERKGLLALLIKAAKQKGIAVGALFAIVFNLLFTLFVSDVRIEGLENISEPSFREKLREAGLEVGSLWHTIDKNNLEAQLLDENKDIAWLTVNRKGTVAYVKVIESTEHNDVTDKELVGNIVADRDCIIEEIRVERGIAKVKVGDVVREGDILISGVSDTPSGTVVEAASGEVLGRAVDDIRMFLPREEVVYSNKTGDIGSLSLKVLKFNINIFTKYRNLSDSCDIIDAEKEFVLFGDCKLPFSILYSYPAFREERTVVYSDDELISIGRERMKSAIYTLSISYDIVGVSSSVDISVEGFVCNSRITYVTSVGEFKGMEIK